MTFSSWMINVVGPGVVSLMALGIAAYVRHVVREAEGKMEKDNAQARERSRLKWESDQ